MREIKFRAWDAEKKKIRSMEIDKDATFCILPDGSTCEAGSSSDITGEWYWNVFDEGDAELIVMEYTGLSDRLGKYIFEGDIVGIATEKMDLVGEVYFAEGAFWVKGMLLYDFKRRDSLFEVIGNIYENPELVSHDV